MSWRARLAAWPGLAFFRLRLFFRGVFLLLALATVAIALSVLQDEKELSHRSYRQGFAKTMGQVAAQLRHPAGQLALLNPPAPAASTPAAFPGAVHPLVLPFAALDFDDHNKVEQAVEMAGCSRQYPDGAGLCVALGSNPWAGGFVYVVGHASGPPPVAHRTGEHDLALATRLRVDVALRGRRYAWIAPFEPETATAVSVVRGRLTGFAVDDGGAALPRPVRDFRGWLWQGGPCTDGGADVATCARRAFFSVRLPVEVLHEDVLVSAHPVWPPADMNRIDVRVQWLAPGDGTPLFDSARPGATAPFSLADLGAQLLPGETLQLRKLDGRTSEPLATIKGQPPAAQPASGWMPQAVNDFLGYAIRGLLRRLPIEDEDVPIEDTETIRTAAGSYELHGYGDERSANRALALVATRVSWFVVAMLVALALAWGAIEWTIIRRITMLTKRSRAVTAAVAEDGGAGSRLSALDVADLRGPDELGVLASNLAELLQRVDESLQRERLRAEREKDQWMAVGHEIMSPLQSLIALHGAPDDASRRYILRMQQAVRVLYGSASPGEAFETTTLQLATLELDAFLAAVAANAPHAGLFDVIYDGPGEPVVVRADEYSLEDVVTHVLQNAQRHRRAGTPVTLRLRADEARATVELHNEGDPIPPGLIDKIFEYGVSGAPEDESANGDDRHAPQRGQGLFVAKTYLAKMGGTIAAENVPGGVRFVLALPRA
ncbi:MAG TPA: HAMP domain-containing sensor histidine kinase [Burkholderiaceae bacterium]|nr:HAMP domain-containing sensor histidine kinase [Burkholderiaceae bacterium]